jgi:rhomboid family GlyGly-CTERM serine protease
MPLARWFNTNGLSIYLLLVACLLWGPWSDHGMQIFALDRSGLEQGEFWRLWSGQLVHSSWQHLLLNTAGLVVLQQMFGAELRLQSWLTAFLIISPSIGICWLVSTTITWLPSDSFDYVVGSSALLHGLFAYAACLALRRDRLLAATVLLLIGAKVLWEQMLGPAGFTADLINLPIASSTHLYGYVSGVALGAAMLLIRPANR